MRAIGSMGHTVMVSNLLPSWLSLIQYEYSQPFGIAVCVCAVRCFYSLSTDLTCDRDLSVPQVLSPWNAPTPLLRSWCLWELYCKGQAFCALLYISLALPLLSLTSYIV